jgi:hypothetical protein
MTDKRSSLVLSGPCAHALAAAAAVAELIKNSRRFILLTSYFQAL